MDYTLTTPALLFPALSLIMLAYTNRFVVLAGLIRELAKEHQSTPSASTDRQIKNLNKRMSFIKNMQLSGTISFILCVLSMLTYILVSDMLLLSLFLFISSLIALLISLIFLMRELLISISALTVQLESLQPFDDESTRR